jgi:hypothetical protein
MTYKTGSPKVAITEPTQTGTHWFQIDLGASYTIEKVFVTHRNGNLSPLILNETGSKLIFRGPKFS